MEFMVSWGMAERVNIELKNTPYLAVEESLEEFLKSRKVVPGI
jgi:hypothetical protein